MTLRSSRLLSALAASALFTGVAEAQDFLTRTDGVLGSAATYTYNGTPGSFFLLAPSVTTGPFPLSAFDLTNPNFLDVGFELFPLNLWRVGLVGPTGEGTFSFALPSTNPNLHGLPFYAQAVELTILPSLFGQITNRCDVTLTAACDTVNTLGATDGELDSHSATTLPDGRVVMIGGLVGDGLGGSVAIGTVQMYDPNNETFALTSASMSIGRHAHTATLLDDGRVLLLGGADDNNDILALAEIYDPVTDAVTVVPPMAVPRTQHTATKLDDGRVLVVGGLGTFDFLDVAAALNSASESAEIYDPVTNSWTAVPDLGNGRVGHDASLLGDGRVLVTGGLEVIKTIIPIPFLSDDCRRYDPGTNSWLATASMPGARAIHAQIRLANGDALIAGGGDGSVLLLAFGPLADTARYNHLLDTWTTTAPLNFARANPNLVDTGSEIVATGGLSVFDIQTLTGIPVQEMEKSDNGFLSWQACGTMILARELVQTNVIDDGQRILNTGIGLNGGIGPDLTAEIAAP